MDRGATALVRLRDEASQNGFQFHFALDDVGFLAFEGDPAFIEPVEHAHTRQRFLHTLGPEQRLPHVTLNDFRDYCVAKNSAKRVRDIDWSYTLRPLQLDETHTTPDLQKQLCGNAADVCRGDHRYGLVERLQKAGNRPRIAGRRHIPRCVLHVVGVQACCRP